jgi:hypothetical protein
MMNGMHDDEWMYYIQYSDGVREYCDSMGVWEEPSEGCSTRQQVIVVGWERVHLGGVVLSEGFGACSPELVTVPHEGSDVLGTQSGGKVLNEGGGD